MRNHPTAIALLIVLMLTGCRTGRWEWVEDVPVARAAPIAVECPGGRVNQTRRTLDSSIGGRVRNTTIRTDACLE